MFRAFVPAVMAAFIVLGGCWKSETKAVLKADGSGTLKYDTGYKVESLEAVKAQAEERMDQGGGGGGGAGPEQVEERLAEFTGRFEPAKVKSDLKAQGFEVKGAESYEKDGWKGVVVEASFSDINQVMSLIRAQREAARQEAEAGAGGGGEEAGGRRRGGRGMGGMGRMGRGMDTTPVIPAAFKKTDDEKIGKMIITSPRETAAGRGAGGGRGGRGGRGGGGGMGADIPGADEARRTLTIKLPGKIVETANCKKEDDSTVVFEIKSADMQPDEDGNFRSVVQDGAWVRFEIPGECKIKFDEAAPAKAGEAKKSGEGEEDKAKPKKGGLKIGG